MIYTPRLEKAIELSIKTHEVDRKQKRKGKDIPYITHPLTVGIILARSGASEDVIIAGILHDTIEDSAPEKKVTKALLAERFGESVANLVDAVTEQNQTLPWEERKKQALEHLKGFSHDALLVKSADLISNCSEILEDYKMEGEHLFSRFSAPKEKVLWHYSEAMNTILELWPQIPLNEDLKHLIGELGKL
jgi:(p)ppGpp synthase/HD superfamily hydrolase